MTLAEGHVRLLCECRSTHCQQTIDLDLDHAVTVRNSGLVVISSRCSRGPEPTDRLIEQRQGYALYAGRRRRGRPVSATIDIAQLNEASTALYELAFDRGVRAGSDETTRDLAGRHARRMLELVNHVLSHALGLPSGDERAYLVSLAKLITARAPMVSGTTEILARLSGNGPPMQPDDAVLRAVLDLTSKTLDGLPR